MSDTSEDQFKSESVDKFIRALAYIDQIYLYFDMPYYLSVKMQFAALKVLWND